MGDIARDDDYDKRLSQVAWEIEEEAWKREQLKREKEWRKADEASFDPYLESAEIIRPTAEIITLKPLSSSQFISGFVPPDYLIDGLLQRRFIYSLTAPTGGGKTAIALYLAAAVGGADIGLPGHTIEKGRALYLAGENPDDIRMRWITMADSFSFDPKAVNVSFLPGAMPIIDLLDRFDADKAGEFSLVVVDTSPAYFAGEDENNNPQMGHHARCLRAFTDLPGGPTVIACCHPVKGADSENLLPRGGGAFLNEVDGNLTASKRDSIVEIHWQGKFRGPDFSPIGFQLLTTTCTELKDSKGRSIPTVIAKPLTEAARGNIESDQRREEDALLALLLLAPGGSLRSIAEALGWRTITGDPQVFKSQRVAKRLKAHGLVKDGRDGLVLTDKGRDAAKKAA
jgi:hypothetical protein